MAFYTKQDFLFQIDITLMVEVLPNQKDVDRLLEIEAHAVTVSSHFVPVSVSYPDDSYPGSDVSYPLSVSSYPTLWSIRTPQIVTKFLEFLSEKIVKTIKVQHSHVQGICMNLFVILLTLP